MVGMQFEGGQEGSDDTLIYTVTDIAEDKVVVDGNHPLAGMTLRFDCTVTGSAARDCGRTVAWARPRCPWARTLSM